MSNILSALFVIPQFVLLAFGVVMIARAGRGRASVLGMIGCVVLLLQAVLIVAQIILTPMLAEQSGIGFVTTILQMTNIVFTLMSCVGIGLLIWSAASKTPAPTQGPGWQPPQGPQGQPWQQNPQQQGWPQQSQQGQPGGQAWQPPPGQGF